MTFERETTAPALGAAAVPTAPTVGAVAQPYRSLTWLARLSLIGTATLAAIAAALVAAQIAHLRLLGRAAADPSHVALAQILAAEDRDALLSLAAAIAQVLLAILFIAWTYRAYRNVGALGLNDRGYRAGWAVAGWVVPIASLFVPKRIIDEIWRTADPDFNVPYGWRSRPVAGLIHAWWATYLLSNFAAMPTRGLDPFTRPAIWVDLVSNGVAVVSLALAGWLVVAATTRQRLAVARLQGETGPAPSLPTGRLGLSAAQTGWAVAGIGVVALLFGLPRFEAAVLDAPLLPNESATARRDSRAIPFAELRAGDCFLMPVPGDDGAFYEVPVLPCDQPHDGEVVGTVFIPFGPDVDWPGEHRVFGMADDRCLKAMDAYIASDADPGSVEMWSFAPVEESWEMGDRQAACFAVSTVGPLTGSLAG